MKKIIPTEQELKTARDNIIQQAVKPLHDPKLRELLVEVTKKNEIAIDESDDSEYSPFAQAGGLGKVYHLFGANLQEMLSSLNATLAA